MKHKPKRRWASITGNPGNDAVDEPERNGICDQKEDESGNEREFHFQSSGERHVIMWVIFRDPKNVFNHIDKNVVDMVEDKNIQAYQTMLDTTQGGQRFEIYLDVYFLQPFFTTTEGVHYSVRKYAPWLPLTTDVFPADAESSDIIAPLCAGMDLPFVEEIMNQSTTLVELREGDELVGCLFLRKNEITLLGVDAKKKGKRYSKILIDKAKTLVEGDVIRVHPVNRDVADKVYAPQGFVHVDTVWMEAPTTLYTKPSRPTAPLLLRTL